MSAPRTVAQRCLDHLRSLPPGTKLTSGDLASATQCAATVLIPCLEPATKAGLIDRERDPQRPTRLLWWLTDVGRRAALNHDATPAPTPPMPPRSVFDLAPDVIPPQVEQETSAELADDVSTDEPLIEPPATTAAEPGPVEAPGGWTDEAIEAAATEPEPEPEPEDQSISPPRFALWSDGVLEIRLGGHEPIRMQRDETRALIAYLDAISLNVEGEA